MIIRHDLNLVFIHIPKCAGKKLRSIFKMECKNQTDLEELWNYKYDRITERYVDEAHLTLSDIKTRKIFKYLKKYRVIACTRNPYLRLRSAANEYYRQYSKETEDIVKNKMITAEMQHSYYMQIQRKHNYMDPRFIHSMPMHRFTHLGRRPIVDYLITCENLKEDFMHLSNTLELPNGIRIFAENNLDKSDIDSNDEKFTLEEIDIANRIYKRDFNIFKQYERIASKPKKKIITSSMIIDNIHEADTIHWHWGPKASKYNDKNDAAKTRLDKPNTKFLK